MTTLPSPTCFAANPVGFFSGALSGARIVPGFTIGVVDVTAGEVAVGAGAGAGIGVGTETGAVPIAVPAVVLVTIAGFSVAAAPRRGAIAGVTHPGGLKVVLSGFPI